MGRQRLARNKGLPPNLYLNSAGYFYFINPQSKKSKGLGRDKARAMSEARAANAALANMAPSSLVDWVTGKKDYTLADWVPVYKELWIDKTEPAPNTLRNASGYLNRIAAADFAWMRLPDIGTAHAAAFLDGIEEESGAASAVAARARLRDVFRMAETQGLIDQGKNPVSATYTASRAVRRERLTLDQFHAIRACAPVWLQRAMLLAIVTGQRRGDIAGMKFSDQRDGHLYVTQEKSQGTINLQLDVNIRLAAVGVSIGEAIQECRDLIVSRFMVHHTQHRGTARPGDQIPGNGMSNAFQMAAIEAGITAAEGRTPPTFHEIRSLAERLFKAEFGAAFAQSMLGHKNASMTAKYDDLRGQGYQVIAAAPNR
jgi:integrase